MKKTEYFTSQAYDYNGYGDCVKELVEKRDDFLNLNKSKIIKIDNESIIYTVMQNYNYVLGTLSLSYYEKE